VAGEMRLKLQKILLFISQGLLKFVVSLVVLQQLICLQCSVTPFVSNLERWSKTPWFHLSVAGKIV